MDEQLAAIYGTGGAASENDLEKTAAAELLLKIAEAEGVDLNQFSDAQVMAMVHDLTKTASEGEEEEKEESEEKEKESEGDSEEKEEESEEKVAEADFLGRVMAHAYVQELNNIEKQAGAKETAGKALGAIKNYFTSAADDVAAGARKLRAGALAREAGKPGGYTKGGRMILPTEGKRKIDKAMMGAGAKQLGKGVGKIALPAAGVAGAGAGAYHLGKKKESSALDTLAEQRALEMLAEAGYSQEKTASAVEVAVEQRALEMLEANGYPVEWNR